MVWGKQSRSGFTIVELLIVIVVIAVLATITIVAYNNIQTGAYASVVKTDLENIAKKIKLYEVDNGYYPAGSTQLATLNLKISKSVYEPYYNGTNYYNIAYCRLPDVNPTSFSLVAYGKNDANYMYTTDGAIVEFVGAKAGSAAACLASGITLVTGLERDWFYDGGVWRAFVAG